MADYQQTIGKPVTLKGKGLHTGVDVEISFQPAEVNHGYIFKRTDLENQPLVHAIAENVVDTSRGTTLEERGAKVATVEHVLAALNGMGIDNVLIEINGPETPIIDGSSGPFVEAIRTAGIEEQPELRDYFEVTEKLSFEDPDKGIEVAVYPDNDLSIDVKIDYNSKVLGNQYASLNGIHDFALEIAKARTFVFVHELEPLLTNNLIKGGDLDNAIIIMDRKMEQTELDRLANLFHKPRVKVKTEGILNNIELYFPNEPARHKLLDIVGDLALVGQRIKGKIIATRPGHYANTELAKIIRKEIKILRGKPQPPNLDPNDTLLDVHDIMKILPHRPPFLLVDRILLRDNAQVVGVKNVTVNETFFQGHFPGEAIMPGVLQVEAMAQVGGILVLNTVPDPENYNTYFIKIDKVKFKKKVVPGDTVVFRMTLMEPVRRGIAHMWGEAFVGKHLVMEGELMAQIVKDKE